MIDLPIHASKRRGPAPLARLIARRLLLAVVSILIVSTIVFWVVALMPGDTAERILGRDATPAALQALRLQLHLDQPAILRYGHWLAGLLQGDLGLSLTANRPVLPYVAERLENTLILAGIALIMHVPLSIGLGLLLASVRRDGAIDVAISTAVLFGMSIPEFVVAIGLIAIFSTDLNWLPPLALIDQAQSFTDVLVMLAIPAVALNLAITAYVVRQIRGSMIAVMESDYVRMARLRGLSVTRILFVHALPSALGPTINAIALNTAWLVGGIVAIETVANYPGLGRLLVEAISTHDVPMIQGAAMCLSAVYIAVNLAADVMSLILNPRLRYSS